VIFAVGAALSSGAQTAPSLDAPEPGRLKVPYYGTFSELPVGAVQPRGWLHEWLLRQAQGLTGHPENLAYPYDTCMYAGPSIPPPTTTNKWWSPWWPYEQTGYFVDGMTRLSWLVHGPDIIRRRDANLDYIRDHSEQGSLGPSRWGWPNAVVGRALLADFSATGDSRTAQVLQDSLLANAEEITRPRDAKEMFYLYRGGANFEEAYQLYGLTGDRRLLEIGRKVYENYLTNTNSFCSADRIRNDKPFHEHGVTAAEVLKCLPMTYLYTGDLEALDFARRAYQKVVDHNLMADGGIVSSEYLEPTAFDSLHESCDITDWSWSIGYLFMATGDAQWGDLIERTTFNALPGAVTKDFKQLQYFSAVNQVWIGATNSHTPHCPTRMAYRAAHDTECCAGNINRAMPNYTIRMWMRTQSGGLAAVLYGPSKVTTTVNGQVVAITEETDYPFGDRILFRVKTSQPVTFDFSCRIPGWCEGAAIQVNGRDLHGSWKPGTFAEVRHEFHDGDTIKLRLPMTVRFENWFQQQSASVTRGPLVYSLKIAERRVQHTRDPDDVRALLRGHDIRGFPEVEFYPETDWRYGIDAALKNDPAKIKVVESRVRDNPFVVEQAPVHLELPLRHLPGWSVPASAEGAKKSERTIQGPAGVMALPDREEKVAAGKPVMLEMVPYGATHLRLTTLPWVSGGPP
jgi:uncharacterized protein